MYEIIKKNTLTNNIIEYVIYAPDTAKHAKPGQFIILMTDLKGERVPFTIADTDSKNYVTIIVQTVGETTYKLSQMKEGDSLYAFVGPLGNATDLNEYDKLLLVGGGIGSAVIYPQAKERRKLNKPADVIIGAKTESLIIYKEQFIEAANHITFMTDDGSNGNKGFVTDALKKSLNEKKYDAVFAVGPMPMMKAVCDVTKEFGIKTIVSMNSIMVDGTGMCGGCRLTVDGKTKYACVDGPEFDGHLVDFDEALLRGRSYRETEHECYLRAQNGVISNCTEGNINKEVNGELCDKNQRQKPIVRSAEDRVKDFNEVSFGFDRKRAEMEAERCLGCKNPQCVKGCPVNVDIPAFIAEIKKGDFDKALEIIKNTNSLPCITGRVCPQESQCEKNCIRGIKGESVAIGQLERFVAEYGKNQNVEKTNELDGRKVAVVGSGPASLTCAADLLKMGADVTIYEAFHTAGGVLVYGIPEFRLPKTVVKEETQEILNMGGKLKLNEIIGKSITLKELSDSYDAVFLGTGAGLPMFMNIPGEGLNGVYSANEYLTRINLMKAYKDDYATPVLKGKNIIVVGAGNVAMDAARTAVRMGAEKVNLVYRRSRAEMPARAEEIHHAEEEGVIMNFLMNPISFIGENGNVVGAKCIRMELGEADSSGRRRPVEIEGSEFIMPCDMVIVALGTVPNPMLNKTENRLLLSKKNTIETDEKLNTSIENVFAGGDAVTGAATVIRAMGAGKTAAASIKEYLINK